MLVLSRKVGERIQLGDNITVAVVKIQGNAVRIGIEAPQQMIVAREELVKNPREEPIVVRAEPESASA